MSAAAQKYDPSLAAIIEQAWEAKDSINTDTKGEVRDAVNETLDLLGNGVVRIATKDDGAWTVHQWAKKAVLLSFRLNPMSAISGGPGDSTWWDKVPSKFDGWGADEFTKAGFRAVTRHHVKHAGRQSRLHR